MDRLDAASQHIALTTAAALVYFQVTGRHVHGSMERQTRGILCDVAHALSMLAPVYVWEDSSAMPRELAPSALIGAKFERGANLLVSADGTTHRNLTIQRKDMKAAVAVFKQCGFERRWDSGS